MKDLNERLSEQFGITHTEIDLITGIKLTYHLKGTGWSFRPQEHSKEAYQIAHNHWPKEIPEPYKSIIEKNISDVMNIDRTFCVVQDEHQTRSFTKNLEYWKQREQKMKDDEEAGILVTFYFARMQGNGTSYEKHHAFPKDEWEALTQQDRDDLIHHLTMLYREPWCDSSVCIRDLTKRSG